MKLPIASREQKFIIDNLIKKTNNVVTDSVAGSGKTTTILLTILAGKDNKIEGKYLILTYNKRLKIETRTKISDLGLNETAEVHSYHSFGVKYYTTDCMIDNGIINCLRKDLSFRGGKDIPKYTHIFIDEAQDMTEVYFMFINKIIKDIANYVKDEKYNPQLFIIGDIYQSIFAFNNADARHITYADKIFTKSKNRWMMTELKTSFRLTKPMARFVNDCVLNIRNKMISLKTSSFKPQYIICNTFKKFNTVYKTIKKLLSHGLNQSDIFIIAPSVKSPRSPVRTLANKLSNDRFKVYVSNSDSDRLDSDVINNKIVFTTYHSVKGLERKVVIVYGFDDSYFKYYGRNLDTQICPNAIYVAVTRATQKLYLVHHLTNNYLPFLNVENLVKCCNIIGQTGKISTKVNRDEESGTISVTDIPKYMDSNIIMTTAKMLSTKVLLNSRKVLKLAGKVCDDEAFIESVSEINGHAIPMYFELMVHGKIKEIDEMKSTVNKAFHFPDNINSSGEFTVEAILYIANMYNFFISGYNYKVNQIKKYNWMNDETMIAGMKRMAHVVFKSGKLKCIPDEIEFEKAVSGEVEAKLILGNMDMVDHHNKVVWEFKCVNELKLEHVIQLMIYMYLYGKSDYRYYLYNIVNDKLVEIIYNEKTLSNAVSYIIREKFAERKISDEAFIIKSQNAIKNIKTSIDPNFVHEIYDDDVDLDSIDL